MGFLIDTSILIHTERALTTLDTLLSKLGDENTGISVITAAELLHGIHRAENQGTKLKRSAFVEAVLEKIPIYPFDLKAARLYAALWAQLTKKGTPIGTHDLQIGATALSLGYAILTYNEKDFSRIPGLTFIRA